MSSTDPSQPQPRTERRGSLSLSEYFSSSRVPQPTSTIASAASSAASQRRVSTSNNSPPQFSPGFNFNSAARRGSVSSVSSTSSAIDENAVDDADGTPTSPLARRMSWGASAFQNIRIPAMMTSGVGPKSASATSPTVTRGFWEAGPARDPQPRRQSISTMPTPPVNELPKAKVLQMPQRDHVQERMLKGELYMD